MQVGVGLGVLGFGEAQRLGGQFLGAETARYLCSSVLLALSVLFFREEFIRLPLE
jgi:hypothetical protein